MLSPDHRGSVPRKRRRLAVAHERRIAQGGRRLIKRANKGSFPCPAQVAISARTAQTIAIPFAINDIPGTLYLYRQTDLM